MSYNVIHGIGAPRIITSSVKVAEGDIDTVSSETTLTIHALAGSKVVFLLDSGIGRLAVTKDANGDTIFSRVTQVLTDYNTFVFTAWLGGDPATGNIPVLGNKVEFYGFVLDLPLCQNLIEGFKLDGYDKKFENGDIEPVKKGWYYSAVLDYSGHVKAAVLKKIGILIDITQKKFLLYPRSDNPDISYVVDFAPGFTLQFQQKKHHKNHKLVVLELRGLKRLAKPDFDSIPNDQMYGYGEYFGYYH